MQYKNQDVHVIYKGVHSEQFSMYHIHENLTHFIKQRITNKATHLMRSQIQG